MAKYAISHGKIVRGLDLLLQFHSWFSIRPTESPELLAQLERCGGFGKEWQRRLQIRYALAKLQS